jgi:hypothetical protein
VRSATIQFHCRPRDGVKAVRTVLARFEDQIRHDLLIGDTITYAPIQARISLGSVLSHLTGQMHFVLTVSAPQNKSQLVRDLVNLIADELRTPRGYAPLQIEGDTP